METNAGSRVISQIGTIPGHGPVWVDKEAICNLLALCDLVRRYHRVKYDLDIGDWFDVISKSGVWMRFVANKRGLYVKEKMAVIRNQIEKTNIQKQKMQQE